LNGSLLPHTEWSELSNGFTPESNGLFPQTWINGEYTPVITECKWKCNKNYHKENGICVSNTKTMSCSSSGISHAQDLSSLVTITWTGSSWSTPATCGFTCTGGYHKENGKCVSNTKVVSCTPRAIHNAIRIIPSDVKITWTGTGWSTPATCDYSCKQGYHKENGSCEIVYVPLYRYIYSNSKAFNHFYTTDWSELGSGKYGYRYEGIEGYVCKSQIKDTVPLYRYYSNKVHDHLYTTNWNELGSGKHSYIYKKIEGYVYKSQKANTVPLYRYYSGKVFDHFYTTDWSELGSGRSSYIYEKIEGYLAVKP